jgi:prepilin-type N-terminal cleavage/methylation domain-containing protein
MEKGFSLLEIIIGAAIMSLTVLGAFAAVSQSLSKGLATTEKVKASLYAEEALEAMRQFRDDGWANLGDIADGTTYYLSTTTVAWATSTTATPLLEGVYYRAIVVSDVYRRDSDNDIVDSGDPDPKTVDPNTRRVDATVSWKTQQIVFTTYLANIFE